MWSSTAKSPSHSSKRSAKPGLRSQLVRRSWSTARTVPVDSDRRRQALSVHMFGRDKEKSDTIETLPMVPLRDVVVFPHMMIPFVVGRPSSIKALDHALLKGKRIFLSAQ